MIGWLPALPWVRRLRLWLAAAGAFLVALAALRRSGERSGRLQEDSLNRNGRCPLLGSGCCMHRAIVLAGVEISLGACATASSERTGSACVPVPEYRQKFLDRAADEVEHLPEDSGVARMLEDYPVMRAQGRVCS